VPDETGTSLRGLGIIARTKYYTLQHMPNFILRPLMRWQKRRLLADRVGADPEGVFTEIFHTHGWPGESVSGHGSELARTVTIRAELPKLLRTYNIRSLVDAPCGDFHWMQHVDLGDCRYFGVDIVKDLIEQNEQRYGSSTRSFVHADITRDTLPRADLILCRDCFIHLPFEMAIAAVRNFKRSGATYLLTTTFPTKRRHWDTPVGGLHWINMELEPFNFPPPLLTILEEREHHAAGPTYSDRSLGLWRLADITC
jgi:hypothetical protein